MPELPEVQTVVDGLREATLIGATITDADISWPRTIGDLAPSAFVPGVRGQTIAALHRRAKYIVIEFASKYNLIIHLRMTGKLYFTDLDEPRSKHEHVVLTLDDNRQLRFHDTRKFGRVNLTDDPTSILGNLGPEPLEPSFTADVLGSILRGRKRLLKPLLLDQTLIAGLGNIYVDEALWEAQLHPCRQASSLKPAEVQALWKAIPLVLQRGLQNLGTSLGEGQTNFYSVAKRKGRNRDQLNVFRRTEMPCPRCGTTIERLVVGQRSTHVCLQCQPTPAE